MNRINPQLTLILVLLLNIKVLADTEWAPVKKGSGRSGLSVTGKVIPQDGALNIESARVQGRVLSFLKREGEHVSEGAPIYSVSSPECYSLQEESRVAYEKKITDLIEGVKKRERQLGLKLAGEDCEIVATHAGVLTKRALESGGAFNVGDILATVLDIKRLTVELEIPEKDEGIVHTGQSVTLQFASAPGKEVTAKVQDVVPTIDPTTRTSKARLVGVKLPANIGLEGLVTADIQTGSSGAALEVPPSALVFYHDRRYVVSGTNQKPRAVEVDVLNETDTVASVRPRPDDALKAGEQVVIKGGIFLLKKSMVETMP